MPAVTVHWKPSGLPIAATICPTRSVAERPSSACGRPLPDRRSTAVSVAASSPTRVGVQRLAVGERGTQPRRAGHHVALVST